MNLKQVAAIAVYAIRTYLTDTGTWVWNGDIQRGIIPGLRCWYCQPWQAPYGLIWHIVSLPGILFGGTPLWFISYVSMIDFAVLMLISRKPYPILFATYLPISMWIWLQAPYDIPVLWFTVSGIISWPLVFLGPIAKLPLGAPKYVWDYVLGKPYVASDWLYYELMGVVFVAVLIQYYLKSRVKWV